MSTIEKLAVLLGLGQMAHRPQIKHPGPQLIGAKWRTKHKGPGTAKSYHDRSGSGLLTRDEIVRRRGGNPKGAY